MDSPHLQAMSAIYSLEEGPCVDIFNFPSLKILSGEATKRGPSGLLTSTCLLHYLVCSPQTTQIALSMSNSYLDNQREARCNCPNYTSTLKELITPHCLVHTSDRVSCRALHTTDSPSWTPISLRGPSTHPPHVSSCPQSNHAHTPYPFSSYPKLSNLETS